jgi:pantoate--beta-alanine ligase
VEIIGVDTVRAPDGLALSSRNGYLTPQELKQAPQLYAALRRAADGILKGQPPADAETAGLNVLKAAGWRPDYFSVRRRRDLGVPGAQDRALVILAAAWLGRARLIDNIELDLNPGG